jgi:hypothetical protein
MHREYFRPSGRGFGRGGFGRGGFGRGGFTGQLWNAPVYYNSYREPCPCMCYNESEESCNARRIFYNC